jgi:hypothetical protein
VVTSSGAVGTSSSHETTTNPTPTAHRSPSHLPVFMLPLLS